MNGHMKTGGCEKALLDLLRNFDFETYDVSLLLIEEGEDYLSEIPKAVTLIQKPLNSIYGSIVKSLMRCLRKTDFRGFAIRLLFIISRWTNVAYKPIVRLLIGKQSYDCAIAFRKGVCADLVAHGVKAKQKLLWWHHGVFNLDGNTKRAFIDDAKKMSGVVSVSQSCADFLIKELPEIKNRLFVIPNMVSGQYVKDRARGQCPYSKNEIAIVSVGHLHPEKHHDNCIYAAKCLRQKNVCFKWYILGDGPERSRLTHLIEALELQDVVILTGNQPNPYPYMVNADLFVHPSYVESQGLVVLEAMALGVPCIVTKSLGPCEFIQDGENALLTEQSPESLAEKVIQILENHELYNHIKTNTCCPPQFMPEKVMEKLKALLGD